MNRTSVTPCAKSFARNTARREEVFLNNLAFRAVCIHGILTDMNVAHAKTEVTEKNASSSANGNLHMLSRISSGLRKAVSSKQHALRESTVDWMIGSIVLILRHDFAEPCFSLTASCTAKSSGARCKRALMSWTTTAKRPGPLIIEQSAAGSCAPYVSAVEFTFLQ